MQPSQLADPTYEHSGKEYFATVVGSVQAWYNLFFIFSMWYSDNFVVSSAVLLLTSSTLVLASPLSKSPNSLTGATFGVTQVLNPNHVPNGALAYAKTLRKYGAPIPDSLRAAVLRAANTTGLSRHRRQTGGEESTDTATPEGAYDVEYLSPVSIGTPAQQVNLDFDTGSADL